MSDQPGVIAEALSALRADEPFLPGVDDLVDDEMGFLGEAFPAQRAHERFITRVSFLVLEEVRTLIKTLSALRAGKWLLPRVATLVLDQIGITRKALPAFCARVWLLPGVNSPMDSEMREAGKIFPTVRTNILFKVLDIGIGLTAGEFRLVNLADTRGSFLKTLRLTVVYYSIIRAEINRRLFLFNHRIVLFSFWYDINYYNIQVFLRIALGHVVFFQ